MSGVPLLAVVLLAVGGFAAAGSAVAQESGGDAFEDVGAEHHFYEYIQELAAAGLFEGVLGIHALPSLVWWRG